MNRWAPTVVLASKSPARLATLRGAGLDPRVIVSGYDESQVGAADPAELATELATAKAEVVAARIAADRVGGFAAAPLVIGCDSVLALDGAIHGKPVDVEEARSRWRAMRGRSGVLYTGHCVIEMASGQQAARAAATTVHFADITDGELEAYLATGEPMEVAGAFTLDGLGGAFVTGVEGDPHSVVGISLPLLRRMLAGLGIVWTDLWATPGLSD